MSDEVSNRLQHVRKMYGLSQRELAKRSGVTNSSVSMIEQGKVSPSMISLEKLLGGIPMTVKDFFSFNYTSEQQCFFEKDLLLESSENGVESYNLHKQLNADIKSRPSSLVYQVYQPGSDSGQAMTVSERECGGYVVSGQLDITINSLCQTLNAGDGFVVEALCPYRVQNNSDAKAIVVMSNHAVNVSMSKLLKG